MGYSRFVKVKRIHNSLPVGEYVGLVGEYCGDVGE